MKPEQKLWEYVRPLLQGHVTRIENSVASGMPDVIQICEARTNWIELKHITGDWPVLRKEQYAWMSKAHIHGGNCYLIANFVARPSMLFVWMPPFKIVPAGEAGKYVEVREIPTASLDKPSLMGGALHRLLVGI